MADKIHTTSGKRIVVEPKNGKYYTLEEMQDIVGGYIEIIWLDRDDYMVINEEGKLNGLPFNASATALLRCVRPTDDFIVGNALVCHKSHLR